MLKRLLNNASLPAALWTIASLVYLVANLSPWVYPGDAAAFMAQFLGTASPASVAMHPIADLVFGTIGRFLPISCAVWSLNLATAIFGALSVGLLSLLAARFFALVIDEPRSKFATGTAASLAAAAAGTLTLSPDFLRSATHLQWQVFDLFLILSGLLMLVRVAERGTKRDLYIAGFVWGFIALEAPLTLILTPFFLIAMALAWSRERERVRIVPLVRRIGLSVAAGGLLGTAVLIVRSAAPVKSTLLAFGLTQWAEIRLLIQGPWLLILFFGVLPFVLALFCARDLGSNRRTPTVLFTYLITALLLGLAAAPLPNIAPLTLAKIWTGAYPVALAAMMAFTLAFVVGGGVLLICVKTPPEGGAAEWRGIRRSGRKIAFLSIVATVGATIFFGVRASFRTIQADRPIAGLTQSFTDRLLAVADGEEEIWLLGDGLADPYLKIRIAERGLPVVLFSMKNDYDSGTLARLRSALRDSPYFAKKPDLRDRLERSLDLRVFAFIQDWLRADPESGKVFATIALPDLWYVGDRLPLPFGVLYRGAADREAQMAALKTLAPKLDATYPGEISDEAARPLRNFAAYARRQYGFVANNTAFYLVDADRRDDAYQLFWDTYAYDPENVSALFNIVELVNGGLHSERQEWCRQELDALQKRLKGRQYVLWALARTYGYVHNPTFIASLAGSWVMSGQPGAALSGLDLALEMLDVDRRESLQGAIASVYSLMPGQREEAIARMKARMARETNPQRSLAYLREMIRLNLLDGKLDEAKTILEQAEAAMAGSAKVDLSYERALFYAAAGDATRARIALQTHLELQPKHKEAVAILATLQLQNGELDDLRANTLPSLILAAGTEDDYHVLTIRAQLDEHDKKWEAARAAYLRALALKPEAGNLRNKILTLDIMLADKNAAARHARQYLYQDRTLPLANYVMGSIALGEGDLRKAHDYLTVATAPAVRTPFPPAYNDLAETLNRMGKWPDALAAAQQAYTLDPSIAAAHDTAATALIGLDRRAEALAELDKADALCKQQNRPVDPRFTLTRARLQALEGHPDLARGLLAEVRPHRETFDRATKELFDTLAKEVNLR